MFDIDLLQKKKIQIKTGLRLTQVGAQLIVWDWDEAGWGWVLSSLSLNFNWNHALTSHVMDASCPSDVSSNDVVWWRGGNEETLDLFNWRLPG